jgi:hypothetical protein
VSFVLHPLASCCLGPAVPLCGTSPVSVAGGEHKEGD